MFRRRPRRPPGGEDKGPDADKNVYKVAAGNSPSKGPKDAPLEVIVFSDFQCPFCSRVEPSLTQLEKEYAGKVRMVWKNYPLPFHNNAEPAAQAAMAAHAQGKFWQMHDTLFANLQALDRAGLEKYAQEVGLNMAKFKADLDASKYKAADPGRDEGRPGGRRQRHARRCSSTGARSRAPTRSRRSRRSPTRSWPRRPARSAA